MTIDPYEKVVLMKVGFHTTETLDCIIARKREEDSVGPFYWGYGGTVCHPVNQIQPFVRESISQSQTVYLLMSFTPSKYIASEVVSTHFSTDRQEWRTLPDYVRITGSKYALVCRNIREVDLLVNLDDYVVGIGPKIGTRASDYLRQRVDKMCAKYQPTVDKSTTSKKLQIQYIAEIVEPYAVFLR
jgi:hypothetical protein